MEASFWTEAWDKRHIGFHNADVHPLLAQHFTALKLPAGARVFVPLCGKSLDMAWLLAQGYRVAGCELVETAVAEFFTEMDVTPRITDSGVLKTYRADNIEIYVGDIFDLGAAVLGDVDAVYDRAALVAFPPDMRARYAPHVRDITQNAPQLLITFDYDPAEMDGPPFYVSDADVTTYYGKAYQQTILENVPLDGGLRGGVKASEVVRCLHDG